MTTKYLPAKDLLDLGVLQELNRRFMHPMGLALELVEHDDGTVTLGGVWDHRDDPEGMLFTDELLATPEAQRKFESVEALLEAHRETRVTRYGWQIQPLKNSK